MKFLLYLLTTLTVGQSTFGVIESIDFTKTSNRYYDSNETEETEYEAMNRAALFFGTKIRQSYFDKKSGYTTWTGTGGNYNYLYRTKMKSDLTGPNLEAAWVPRGNGNKTKQLEVSGQNIFYGDQNKTYYFSRTGIFKFEWKKTYENYGLLGGLGGILGGVGGILGGVGGILGGVVGLLVPNIPKQEPVTGNETKPIEVYGREVKDAVYNPIDKSITYVTLDYNKQDWRITKYYEEGGRSFDIASGTGTGNYPILSVEENSKDIYFAVDGEVLVCRNDQSIEQIAQLEDKRQVYDIFVDSEGMYIGLSDSSDTSFEAHDEEKIRNAKPATIYIDRIKNEVTKPPIEGDGYIRNVMWVNDMTKYVAYDSIAFAKSNSYEKSEYKIDAQYLNPNLTEKYNTNPRYSGFFDYGVMYQADESYKIKNNKGNIETRQGQINRVYNDKFQETIRSSNLIGTNHLNWTLGKEGEVYVWYDNSGIKPKLTLSANSYIKKVLLTKENIEEPVENGVIYNKTSETNQYWEIEVPEHNAKEGYDLYVQFFDEEKQPDNFITSLIRLRPTDKAKIDLSEEGNSIKDEIISSNDIKESEILAALSKVTGTKITSDDITITIEKASYKNNGKIIIKAKENSKLVINSQIIEIPHLIYDISKTKFPIFTKDGIQQNYKETVIHTILEDMQINDSTIQVGDIDDKVIDIAIELAQTNKNGYILVKAIDGVEFLKGQQTIVLPATGAISLQETNIDKDFKDKKIDDSASDDEIIILVNEIIKNSSGNPPTIESSDIIIERKLPAKVGSDGLIIVKASLTSVKISDWNEIKTNKLKYDLTKFVMEDPSNLIQKPDIMNRLNLITGLGSVTENDFEFKLEESNVEKLGKITITAKDNSEYLQKEFIIDVPKTRNLAEKDLFKYNVEDEQKDFIFYEDTSNEDIAEYLQEYKNWTEIEANDISFSQKDSKWIIEAKNLKKVGSTNKININNIEVEAIEVVVKPKRTNLNELQNGPIDLQRIDIKKIKGSTDAEMLDSLKKILFEESKNKLNSNIDINEVHIEIVDRYNFKISANQDSQIYVGEIQGIYYLQTNLDIYEEDFEPGVLIDSETKISEEVIIKALKEQYYDLFFMWDEAKFSLDESNKKIIIEGKDNDNAKQNLYLGKSVYDGKIEVEIVVPQDLKHVIDTIEITVDENTSNEAIIDEIKNVNKKSIRWNKVNIKIQADKKSAKLTSKDKNYYTGEVEIKINLTKDLSRIITIDHKQFSKDDLIEEKIEEKIKEQNPLIIWNKVDILVKIEKDEAIIKITSKDKKIYTNEFNTKVSPSKNNDQNGSDNDGKKTKMILLWVFAVINTIAIIFASLFVKNKKKDEE